MKCRLVGKAVAWLNQGTRTIPHPVSSPARHPRENTKLTACDQSRSGRSECEEPRSDLCQIPQPPPPAKPQSERGFLRNLLSSKEIVAKSSTETVGLRHITCMTTTVEPAGTTRSGRYAHQSPGFFRSSCERAFQLIHSLRVPASPFGPRPGAVDPTAIATTQVARGIMSACDRRASQMSQK